jgi:hypothetical protein
MNRPSLFSFAIGNLLSVPAILAVTALACYRWCTQQQHHEHMSWLVPTAALMASKASLVARGRIADYRRWSRAWDRMSGAGGNRTGARSRPRVVRALLAWVAWVGLGAWLCQPHPEFVGTPVRGLYAATFGALTLWGVSVPVIATARWLRRRVGAIRAPRTRDHVVAIALPVPRSSPTVAAAAAAVPDYCHRLMATSARPPDERHGFLANPSPGDHP